MSYVACIEREDLLQSVVFALNAGRRTELRFAYIMVDLWLASVVNFESSAVRTRDRQREELERVDLLFVDLDGPCRDYTYLRQSKITLAKSQ